MMNWKKRLSYVANCKDDMKLIRLKKSRNIQMDEITTK